MKTTLIAICALVSISASAATPESLGVSSKGIMKWIDACEKELHELHGFVLLRYGQTVAEGSWAPYDTLNVPHVLFSHSKSFTSTAVGFAVDDHKLDLDERVVELFKDKAPANPSENLRQLRVRDLLTMTTGYASHDAHRSDPDGDWEKAFLAADFTNQSGRAYLYDSTATYMLGSIVERCEKKPLWNLLNERLFVPLGITNAWTTFSPSGTPCGGWGMYMTTRDIAKFGQLYLDRGVWQEKRLLSDEWIQLATARQTWSGPIPVAGEDGDDWHQGYGFQFWRCRHGFFRADGASGQLTVVMPRLKAVLSVHAGLEDMQHELDLVWKYLVPAFSEGKLEEDPIAAADLVARLQTLRIPTPAGKRDGAAGFCGKRFTVSKDAPGGLRSVQIDPADGAWVLSLETSAGLGRLPVGFGEWKKGTVRFKDGPQPIGRFVGVHPAAAAAAVGTNGVFSVRAYLTDASHLIDLDFTTQAGKASVAGRITGLGGKKFTAVPADDAGAVH